MNLPDDIEKISSKKEFLSFLSKLIDDSRLNNNGWENKSLPDYLEAMSSWIEDMEGYYINANIPIPQQVSWKVFADILIAATMYE